MSHHETRTAVFNDPSERRFRAGWESGRPESIESCLPPAADASYPAALERLILLELDYSWRRWSRLVREASSTQAAESIEPPTPIEDYVDRFAAAGRVDVLRRLVAEEFVLRQQFGDGATLEEYQERFPQIQVTERGFQSVVGTVAHRFDADALANALETRIGAAGGDAALPQKFSGYELLGELGRGGMGVVFRARQLNANRLVALKVIRRDRLDCMPRDSQTTAIDRFRHEAQAAARLEHDHIVTVYEVGEFEGHQFYSMRYVDGCSLADLLRKGPLGGRLAASYLEPVSRAVHEAHQHGILHRDLKPQNILLDQKTSRTLVADFGLAKLTEGGEELTRAGEIMGTPPYMSPEQARDSGQVGVATDVYALGATMYHLLTGRPPFQAATGVETLRQVLDEEPIAPRQLNPAIDADLETITLKCLQKEPARRYESARALADDLSRYVKGEPISARPISGVERLWRWRRRNPLTAALIGSTAAFLVLALVATVVGLINTERQREIAAAQRDIAVRRLVKTREAVDELFTEAAENDLLNQPGLQPVQRTLLKKALDYYEWLLADAPDDPTLADEVARSRFRVGRIVEMLESPAAALPHYRQALASQQRLLAERPDDLLLLADVGETHNFLGRALTTAGDVDQGLEHFQSSVEFRQRAVERSPGDIELARRLANAIMNRGSLEQAVGDLAGARASQDEAQRIRREALIELDRRQLAGDDEIRLRLQYDLGKGSFNSMKTAQTEWEALTRATDDPSSPDRDAELRDRMDQRLGEAITAFRAIHERRPEEQEAQQFLATCLLARASLRAGLEDIEAAETLYAEALQHFESLCNSNPTVLPYKQSLADAHIEHGFTCFTKSRLPEATGAFQRAYEIYTELSAQTAAPTHRLGMAKARRMLGEIAIEQRDEVEANAAMREALQTLDLLIAEQGEVGDYVAERAETLRMLESLQSQKAPATDIP